MTQVVRNADRRCSKLMPQTGLLQGVLLQMLLGSQSGVLLGPLLGVLLGVLLGSLLEMLLGLLLGVLKNPIHCGSKLVPQTMASLRR